MSDWANHLGDVFRLFGPVEVRRLFGGYGVYHDGLMFGLVADDALYLKADAVNVADFQRRDLPQIEYARQDRAARLPTMAPAEVMDGGEEAARWARRSFEAALRAGAKRRKARRKTPS